MMQYKSMFAALIAAQVDANTTYSGPGVSIKYTDATTDIETDVTTNLSYQFAYNGNKAIVDYQGTYSVSTGFSSLFNVDMSSCFTAFPDEDDKYLCT
mmetsp:Transcript_12421/g.15854  ORF Transcript_12421/g.15854 Transcript_12421/m.15854 type:complete len:97 (+) Transcript_12421:16-306(+)